MTEPSHRCRPPPSPPTSSTARPHASTTRRPGSRSSRAGTSPAPNPCVPSHPAARRTPGPAPGRLARSAVRAGRPADRRLDARSVPGPAARAPTPRTTRRDPPGPAPRLASHRAARTAAFHPPRLRTADPDRVGLAEHPVPTAECPRRPLHLRRPPHRAPPGLRLLDTVDRAWLPGSSPNSARRAGPTSSAPGTATPAAPCRMPWPCWTPPSAAPRAPDTDSYAPPTAQRPRLPRPASLPRRARPRCAHHQNGSSRPSVSSPSSSSA